LVALAIIVLLLVSLWAYTQNWPPIYVVESNSMQHAPGDQLGLIYAGDLILAQKSTIPSATTYYAGVQTGYSTYGEYGDVLLYYPYGLSTGTPIIHRAILYLNYVSSGYTIPDLFGLPCGNASNALYSVSTTPNHCLPIPSTVLTGSVSLYHVGWQSVSVSIDLGSMGGHSGFLTMGDNNFQNGVGTPDQPILSSLVEMAWIVGVARGILPWFGAFKLLISGNAGNVSPQSWEFLGITVVAVVLLAFGIHYALRAEGIEDERRKQEEEEEAEDRTKSEKEATATGGIRPWRTDEEGNDETEAPRHRWPFGRRPSEMRSARGRPRPRVRKDSPDEYSRRRGRKRGRNDDQG
jgi:signal peptidase